jgi:hypothetical protein
LYDHTTSEFLRKADEFKELQGRGVEIAYQIDHLQAKQGVLVGFGQYG